MKRAQLCVLVAAFSLVAGGCDSAPEDLDASFRFSAEESEDGLPKDELPEVPNTLALCSGDGSPHQHAPCRAVCDDTWGFLFCDLYRPTEGGEYELAFATETIWLDVDDPALACVEGLEGNELVLEVDAPTQLGPWTCQLDGTWSDEL